MTADVARSLADLCERELTVARDADDLELTALASRLDRLNDALRNGGSRSVPDAAARAELQRALTAVGLLDTVLRERRREVSAALKGVVARSVAARAYGATL